MSSLGNWYEQEIQESPSYDEIPAGVYKVVIDEAEARTSKANHVYLNFKLAVAEGEFENRIVFEGFHINHPTAGARARGNLVKLCNIHGFDPKTTEPEMFNFDNTKKFLKLTRKNGKKEGDFYNDLTEWDGKAPAAPAPAAKPTESKPSWAQ